MITTEQINEIISAMEQYEKRNYGLKYGEGFPELARVLMASEKFVHLADALSAMGLLSSLMIPSKEMGDGSGRAAKFLEESSMRGMAAGIFYAGYKAGVAAAEVRALNAMDTRTMPEPVPFEAAPVTEPVPEERRG